MPSKRPRIAVPVAVRCRASLSRNWVFSSLTAPEIVSSSTESPTSSATRRNACRSRKLSVSLCAAVRPVARSSLLLATGESSRERSIRGRFRESRSLFLPSLSEAFGHGRVGKERAAVVESHAGRDLCSFIDRVGRPGAGHFRHAAADGQQLGAGYPRSGWWQPEAGPVALAPVSRDHLAGRPDHYHIERHLPDGFAVSPRLPRTQPGTRSH